MQAEDCLARLGALRLVQRFLSSQGDRRLGLGKFSGDPLNGFRRDAGDSGYHAWAVLMEYQVLIEIEPSRPMANKIGIMEFVRENDMGYGHGQSCIRPWANGYPLVSLCSGDGVPWADDHDFCAIRL